MNRDRRTICVIVAICMTGPALAASASPQDLGRLFTTPQKRAMLDALRQSNVRMDVQTQQTPESVRLDGIVRRSSGAQTLWINGRPYDDRAPVTYVGERSARIITGSKGGVELKVGESARLSAPPSTETPP